MSDFSSDQDGRRQCRDCSAWKPLEDFCASSKRPSGKGSYCKPCFNERATASRLKRAEAEGRVVQQREKLPDGYRRCPDCKEIRSLEAFPLNRSKSSGRDRYCRPCHNERTRKNIEKNHGSTRERHLKRRYGMSQQDFDALLAEQGGQCAICGAPAPEHVDHDHVFGNVRGILCFNCNGGLGQFKDNVGSLRKAIEYLKETTWHRDLIHPGVFQLSSPLRGPRRSPSS
ncbi:recombination endonuclease VII [Longispora fulva]|uniref:Recombination endonuclease VII n=1 Tax=Longispora fulva TaxID=619741 RepID=A0A8J7GIY1_9ACTN|nr:endonuclease VII domain-containing protein [Longispora fulva]MBG6137602.1 hypothetical protein [Longispora fulva]GIG61042.1 recombination endonuclease VII [Longispora fulva]